MTEASKPPAPEGATNVEAFIQDLDAGQFERMLGLALSRVAASVVDNDREGKVKVEFTIKRIAGSHQVHVAHSLAFERPTADGTAGEKTKRTTVFHVGKYGRLTLAPETQTSFLDREGQIKP